MSKYVYAVVADDTIGKELNVIRQLLEDGFTIMRSVPTANAVHYVLVKKPPRPNRVERESYIPLNQGRLNE